jgi:hypothetical protein
MNIPKVNFEYKLGGPDMAEHLDATTAIDHARPAKTCSVCQGPIPWRRWLARNWESVSYCSAVCRRAALDQTRDVSRLGKKTPDVLAAESSAAAA